MMSYSFLPQRGGGRVLFNTGRSKHEPWPLFLLQVITLSSSQSGGTSTVQSATSGLQPLVKLESGGGPGLTASRPMQKYIVVSLPSSASLDGKGSGLTAISSSTAQLEAGMKLERSDSPGASTH